MTEHNIALGLQIVPLRTEKHAYDLIDEAIAVIQKSGVRYSITPFETVMEGKYSELMSIAENAQKAVLDAGADECLIYYRIQLRKSGDVSFEEKNLNR
ncbi:MAG: thiamine-binding protein [Cyclobacteriaceae bacterium]